MSINLQTQPAELRITLEIKRAATGKTETVELIGHVPKEQAWQSPIQPQPETQQPTL
jgi:hypothetical protein